MRLVLYGQLVIADVEPQPCCISKVLPSRTRMRVVEIDERGGYSCNEDAVARAGIAVTDDFASISQRGARRCIVKLTQQLSGGVQLCGREVPELRRHGPRNIGQDLATQAIDAEKPRCASESLVFQVTQ